jgi:hypothetical protein
MPLIETLSARSKSRGPRKRMQSALTFLAVASLVLTARPPRVHAQSAPSANTPDPTEIVWKMVAQNETRAQELKYFTSRRHYHIEFHGLGRSMAADMHVQATYAAASGKTFQVIDESGSHLLLDHVLRKLLETEQDDSRLQKAGLTPFNYNFTFDTQANEDGRRLYVFSVEPKVKNKLLYRGKIWIDAEDFAVVRVEAQPAENPSFWIKDTEIHHSYAKIGDFWLPQTNRSESKTRFGGTAVLTIDYGTYQLEEPHNATLAATPELTASAP